MGHGCCPAESGRVFRNYKTDVAVSSPAKVKGQVRAPTEIKQETLVSSLTGDQNKVQKILGSKPGVVGSLEKAYSIHWLIVIATSEMRYSQQLYLGKMEHKKCLVSP